jgi:hypothetical protein
VSSLCSCVGRLGRVTEQGKQGSVVAVIVFEETALVDL